MRRGRAGWTLVVALAPAVACSAPVARVAQGPVAAAVQKGIASGRGRFDHARWDGLLRAHVDVAGRVDYAGLAKQRATLDAYLADAGQADLATLSGPEDLALLIDVYNACTVRLILDGATGGRLPASIRDLHDPWKQKACTLGGERVSLDTIEHGLLRPLFRDTRIHAAVNCASKSCPPLAPWAFRGEVIDDQLRERMAAMVASEAHVRVVDGRLVVSRIFDWYAADFTDPSFEEAASSVAVYVRDHAPADVRRRIEALGPAPRLSFLDYDWTLNGR